MSAETASLRDAKSILAEFGVACTYTPKDGEARPITAAPGPIEGGNPDEPTGVWSDLSLWLHVLRDKDDAEYSGIDNPQLGDGLRIDSEDEGEVYAFTGGIRNRDHYSMEVEYRKKDRKISGGNRLPR